MAQRVQVLIEDDIDGTEASETINFGLDGVEYEIDLSDKHAQELRDALANWVSHARRSGGRQKTQRSNTSSNSHSKEELQEIRNWARDNGAQVSDRGRVPAVVLDAWKDGSPEAIEKMVKETSTKE